VLVTGATGSGKSTTLASMIDYINRSAHGHIVTIEDPIEFLHRNKNCLVNQREVGGGYARQFSKCAAVRAAAGSRRGPGRRDARPRDDRGGLDSWPRPDT
jgi:Tfp pilus assembly pilus retraction ATPase PilT